MKALKFIIAIILLIILLLAAAAFTIVTLLDPNDYKQQIQDAALEQAGIELNIRGDIGWSFYPWLALELNEVSAGYPQSQPLGQLQKTSIAVSIPALLTGKLQMNRVLIDGLQLELVQTDSGNNWTAETSAVPNAPQASSAEAVPEPDRSKALAIDIEAVEIRNAAVRFIDTASNSRMELDELNLTTGRISLEQPFPLELSLALRRFVADELQLSTRARVDTDVTLNLTDNHYRLDNLNTRLTLIEGSVLPAPLEISLAAGIELRLNEQQATISQLNLNADPLTLKGELKLQGFSQPAISGQLQSNTFNPGALLTVLGLQPPATADSTALSSASFSAVLGGAAGTLELNPLSLSLDDTRLEGEASVLLDTLAIALKLKGNTLDADRYLPPAAAPAESQPASASTSTKTPTAAETGQGGWPREELIPLEPLRALSLNAELDLDSLRINGIDLSQPGLSVSADSGLIRLTRFDAGVFAGQVKATARLDARKAPLSISVSKVITNVEIGTALQTLADTDLLTGKLSAKADLNMTGQSIHAWINSLSGTASVSMAQGVLQGIDAAQSLCQGINNLSSLWIDAEQVDQSTPFADLSAHFNLRNGQISNQDLSARLDAIKLAGRGQVNLPQQTLDYRLGLTIEDNLFNQSCSVNDRLEGVEIPVNCKGGFHDEPTHLCRLDTSFIGDLLKAEAQRKVEEKVGEKVEEKLKEKLGEDPSGLLKGLFGR